MATKPKFSLTKPYVLTNEFFKRRSYTHAYDDYAFFDIWVREVRPDNTVIVYAKEREREIIVEADEIELKTTTPS